MVQTIEEAVSLVSELLFLPSFQIDTDEFAAGTTWPVPESTDIGQAIAESDTPALYRILMAGFSYQGITDKVARNFIALHGNASWEVVARSLERRPDLCPKLDGLSSFVGCGYKKSSHICANPAALDACPVPALPLRKGVLNEQAFSLYFLIRDVCGGDLVTFVDQTLAIASYLPDPIVLAREALIAALTRVSGVSRKLACMMLATMLQSAACDRPGWLAVGKSMVAIDSLVHNFLHRTGILAAYDADHLYGERCVGRNGCEHVIRDLTVRLAELRQPTILAPVHPRDVQHAIWRFCAGDELAICNGNTIRDTARCQTASCPLGDCCGRVALRGLTRDEITSVGQP